MHRFRPARRALALSALVAAFLAASLGYAADDAMAAYTARVEAETLTITGNGASDRLVLVAAGPALHLDVGADGTIELTFDRSTFTAIAVAAGGGNDEVRTLGSLSDELLTMDGGAGNDTLSGGNGADILIGGAGNDHVDGQQGLDLALLGSGNDRFQWDPGDGNDTIEGQGGTDTLDFNGSGAPEILDVSANGPRVRFTRNVANIVLDLDDVEALNLRTLAGADLITVNDLRGTDLRTVDADLNATGGGGDLQPDTVTVNGTDTRDVIRVTASGSQVLARGLAAQTRIVGGEAANDTLLIRTLAGNDDVTVAAAVHNLITPVIDLGSGE